MLVRMIVQGIIALLYTLEIAALLYVTHPDLKEKYYVGVKILCSISFVGIAVLFGAVSKHWEYFSMLLLPLILCALGDWLMALYQVNQKKRNIFLGMVLFLLAHVGFIIMLFRLDSVFTLWNVCIPVIALVSFLILRRRHHFHLGKLLVPACMYCVFLALMLSKAMQYMYHHPGIASSWIGLAGILFFVSDFTINYLYFYKFEKKENRRKVHFINLITYYYAMLAFNMSLLYLVII